MFSSYTEFAGCSPTLVCSLIGVSNLHYASHMSRRLNTPLSAVKMRLLMPSRGKKFRIPKVWLQSARNLSLRRYVAHVLYQRAGGLYLVSIDNMQHNHNSTMKPRPPSRPELRRVSDTLHALIVEYDLDQGAEVYDSLVHTTSPVLHIYFDLLCERSEYDQRRPKALNRVRKQTCEHMLQFMKDKNLRVPSKF